MTLWPVPIRWISVGPGDKAKGSRPALTVPRPGSGRLPFGLTPGGAAHAPPWLRHGARRIVSSSCNQRAASRSLPGLRYFFGLSVGRSRSEKWGTRLGPGAVAAKARKHSQEHNITGGA